MVLSMPFVFYKINSTNVLLCCMLNVRHCLFDVLNPNNMLFSAQFSNLLRHENDTFIIQGVNKSK